MVTSISTPNRFAFEGLLPSDVPRVVTFAYEVAHRAGQRVYVLALEIDGRTVAGRALEGPAESAVVRLGREDAACTEWFGVGDDIVLWQPPTREWSCDLIGRHWERQRQACWGMLVDGRDADGVVSNLQATWPRRHAAGDHLARLASTIGPERKLAMLSYDGYWFSGQAYADCWQIVVDLLRELAADRLEVYENREFAVAREFAAARGLEARPVTRRVRGRLAVVDDISWMEEGLRKRISVVRLEDERAQLQVTAEASGYSRRWMLLPRRARSSRIVGDIGQMDEGGLARLRELLEEAWAWLRSVDRDRLASS